MKNNSNLKKNKIPLKKKFSFLKKLLYSRLLMIIFLLLAQFAIFIVFTLLLEPYANYLLGGSTVISIIFMLYLTNCNGKNEFKIAWLLPVIIFPFFGISLYLFYKINWGGIFLKKNILQEEKNSKKYMLSYKNTEQTLKIYPKVSDIALYLQNSGNYSAYTNTDIKYYPSGEDFFPELIKEIKNAKKFIFIEYFIIDSGYMWNKILFHLKEKIKEGVEVRVLYDSLGSVSIAFHAYEKYLNSQGIQAKIFLPFVPVFDTGLNNRDHRKIFDIDGKVCFTGGLNLTDEYINKDHSRFNYWKDTAIKISGPAVKTFTTMFIQQWNIANKKNTEYAKYVNIEYNRHEPFGTIIPYGDNAFNEEDIAENVYNYILSKSHNYVHIMSPYIIIDTTLLNAMIFAAKRNVNVELIIPKNYDHFITFCVGRTFIKTLIKNGIKVYEYEPGFIHAKSFVSDDNRATVGSINLDYRSLYHHFECGAYIYSSPVIAEIEQDFQNTKKDCSLITLEKYKKIPLIRRIIGWIFRIFAPLM